MAKDKDMNSDEETPPSYPDLPVTTFTFKKNDPPVPGGIYIINETTTTNVLTTSPLGEVTINPLKGGTPTQYQRWVCHHSDGWLGFANDGGMETRYLGHDGKKQMICRAKVHRVWELMDARKREGDGFDIMVENYRGKLPMGVIEQDGKRTVGRMPGTDVWWGFTKVG
ncbi:hypothetical protein AA313_de0206315 [Arthrobotrys entomopaga]|nr:hypothetical protein AA313_de0206315 [Arthrobotrys entomopaga]